MEKGLILIDPDERREVLARRLLEQGFRVDVFGDPAEGAEAALASPPDAVVADLWMPGISGVPLTRLLASEPATIDVPVILRATTDEPRNRFWARHAGAAGYVAKGRMGELVRALRRVTARPRDSFFLQLGTVDVRDRMSAHLDRALFDSVLASEVRALGSAASFARLIDALSQLLVQITTYRWLAVRTVAGRLALHCRPEHREAAVAEARAALGAELDGELHVVEDDDAEHDGAGRPPIVAPILFGDHPNGTIALAPTAGSDATAALVELVGRELGGPLRIVGLVEETQRLATTDPLTGLLRRSPFEARLAASLLGGAPLSVALVDLDHFKSINDRHGHAGGDAALAAVGRLLAGFTKGTAHVAARWGGEEFVLGFQCPEPEARALAAQVCERLRGLEVVAGDRPIPVTGSIGVAHRRPLDRLEDLVDRADHAMYRAKAQGRDQVADERVEAPTRPPEPATA